VSEFFVCSGDTRRAIELRRVVPCLRWLLHVFLNNFLDQDTFLLATQQPHVLREELDRYLAMQTDSSGNAANRSIKAASLHQLRRKLFQYRSPTEKLLLEVSRQVL